MYKFLIILNFCSPRVFRSIFTNMKKKNRSFHFNFFASSPANLQLSIIPLFITRNVFNDMNFFHRVPIKEYIPQVSIISPLNKNDYDRNNQLLYNTDYTRKIHFMIRIIDTSNYFERLINLTKFENWKI